MLLRALEAGAELDKLRILDAVVQRLVVEALVFSSMSKTLFRCVVNVLLTASLL